MGLNATAAYPTSIWDGDSGSRDSDKAIFAAPDAKDWMRLINEVRAIQNQLGIGADADAVAAIGTVGTGVTEVSDRAGIQRTVLTLTNVPITITDGTTKEFGSALLHTFPTGAIKVLGVTINLTAISAEDFDIAGAGDYALGSVAATDQALTGTDVTWSTDAASCTVSTTVSDLHDQGETVALFDGTTSAPVYLNFAMDAGEGAGVITVNGTITILWTNCGDY